MSSKLTLACRAAEWLGQKLRVAFDAAITAFVIGTLLQWLDVLVIVSM